MPCPDAHTVGDTHACRTLLALSDRIDALTQAEWWLVELICRHGVEMAVAAERIGVGVAEAGRMWRDLDRLAASSD